MWRLKLPLMREQKLIIKLNSERIMNAKEFIKQQGFGDINSPKRPINIEIANVAYLMEQYAEIKMKQANDAERSSDKCHIQNVNSSALQSSMEIVTAAINNMEETKKKGWLAYIGEAVESDCGYGALVDMYNLIKDRIECESW